MANSKTEKGCVDRTRLAGDQGYEASNFARMHGISGDQARDLIKRLGNDRDKLNCAAVKLKG